MDQDAIWYVYIGKPRPRRQCVRCGPCCPSPKRR